MLQRTTATPASCLLLIAAACGGPVPSLSDPVPAASVAVPTPASAAALVASAPPVDEPLLCSRHGWCWDHPRKAGPTLNGVWGASRDAVWAVGDEATILRRKKGRWEKQPVEGLYDDLQGVHGIDATHAWAVGGSSILVGDGERWRVERGDVEDALRGVWAADATHVWAVGEKVHFFDGKTWTVQREHGPEKRFLGIGGDGPESVWALDAEGTLHRFDGAAWKEQPGQLPNGARGFTSRGPSDTYASDSEGFVYVRIGPEWNPVLDGNPSDPLGMTGLAAHAKGVAMAGGRGVIAAWDRATTTHAVSDAPWELRAVWSDGDDVVAVGHEGTIVERDGDRLRANNSRTSEPFRDVWALDARHVYALGAYGAVLRWDGSAWTDQRIPSTERKNGVGGCDAGNVFVVGDGGEIWRGDGKTWRREPSGTKALLWSVACVGGEVWVGGDAGLVLRRDAKGAWKAEPTGAKGWIRALWGTDATHLWAVGSGGTILRRDASGWAAQASGVSGLLHGIWGADATHLWVVGDAGVLRGDGTTWTKVSDKRFSDVWGTDATHLWAAGAFGIHRGDGATWTMTDSFPWRIPAAIAGAGDRVWVVADEGTIWVHRGP